MLFRSGPDVQAEVDEATRAIKILGGGGVNVINLNLPISNDGRSIVVINKITSSPGEYPRRAGLPAKKPII